MQIDIQSKQFTVTESIREYAIRRLRFSMTCCDFYIQRIIMRLSDINGPRGGIDKSCHLQIILNGLPDIIIKDIEANLYVAIDHACERAVKTIVRKVDRQKTLLRQCSSMESKYESLSTE